MPNKEWEAPVIQLEERSQYALDNKPESHYQNRPNDGVSIGSVSINAFYLSARDGDARAEERLFEKLSARFGFFAQQRIWDRDDAQEIAQEALAAVCERYKSIEFKVSFAAWAHKVLDNKILEYYKTRSRRREREQAAGNGESAAAHGSSHMLERQLLECLRKLNKGFKRHARILNFHHQGYSVDEICRRLELTRTNLYSILSRARSMLLLCLEKGDIK